MKKLLVVLLLCAAVLAGCSEKDNGTPSSEQGQDPPNPTAQTAEPTPTPTPPAPPVEETLAQEAVAGPATVPTKLGDAAYPLTALTWIKGAPTTLAAGKVYVVEFWATWCPPCRQSIPHLTQLQKKYKDRGVVVIGVSNEEPAKVTPFVETMGTQMDYHVAVDTAGAVVAGYMSAFKQGGIPTAFIVDKQGRVVWHGHPMGKLDEVLEEVLAGTFALAG